MMSDDEHPELDFDPLDDTKVWPENEFPPRPVGRMVLDRMPENFFAENEQIAFGTGVLVDGLDFSDDKMLVGRTFSYRDTQRYRVGPNYLQLPVNQRQERRRSRTNQRDGQMTYHVDTAGRTRTSTTSRRSPAGCARRLPDARRAGPGDQRPADPQADPADQRLHAGRPALPADGAVGAGRPGHNFVDAPLPVRAPDPGADGLALPAGARTSWACGSARASGSAPTTSATCSRWRARRSPTRTASGWRTWARTGRATSSGLTMTHCVPNERVRAGLATDTWRE